MATGGKELSQMSCEDFGEFKVAYPTVMFKYISCNIVCVKVLIFEKQCNSAFAFSCIAGQHSPIFKRPELDLVNCLTRNL